MERFIGCLHLGDERLVTGMRGVKSSDEHDQRLIENWNSVVDANDTVYILGDISMEDSSQYEKLDRLNGKKIVVMGNHDLYVDSAVLELYVDGLCGMKYLEIFNKDVFYKIWLTHAPLHPQELTYVDFNIHAHIHHMAVPKSEVTCNYWGQLTTIISKQGEGYINVDAHVIDYKPKTFAELLENNRLANKTTYKK